MKHLIKNIINEEVLIINEIKLNRKNLMHDLQMMDYDYDEAKEELDQHIEWFKSLPNEMTLYRIINVDDESDINTKEPGSHYSMDKRSLLDNHTYAGGYGDKTFLITVKAKKSLFDIQDTISNNILYPNEKEITLKNKGKGVKIISIKDI